MLRYSELYFTQYSTNTKFSVQNYSIHIKGRKMDCSAVHSF